MARQGRSAHDLIARAQEEIRARLTELEPLVLENDRLERALEALEGLGRSRSAPDARGRPAPTAGRRRPRGTRPGGASGGRPLRGARQRELLALVRETPGLTVSAAAHTMGISSSQASNLVPATRRVRRAPQDRSGTCRGHRGRAVNKRAGAGPRPPAVRTRAGVAPTTWKGAWAASSSWSSASPSLPGATWHSGRSCG